MLKELESISNKLNEAHETLYRVVGALSAADEAAIANPQWNVKDELAHLAGAERGMLGIAQRSARGENPQLPEGYDNDVYNARQVAKRKDQTVAQIMDELKSIHRDLAVFLEGVTEEQLTGIGAHPLFGDLPMRDLLVIIYSHEVNHRIEIQNALRAKK